MKKPTKITDLVPDPENARKRTERSKPLLERSLQEFGAARSVVIDKDGIVRAGNGTIDAATAAGITKVKVIKGKPDELVVVQRDDLEGEKAKAYAIADNRTGELAEWDTDILQDTLDSFGQFTAEDLGFSLEEIFGADVSDDDVQYTKKIASPVYEPKGDCPSVETLTNREKADELRQEIDAAQCPGDIKDFLREASERHVVFDFQRIAEFYCHATEEVQLLMERSGLVIVDFDQAIDCGFVHLTERLGELADRELAYRKKTA